MALRWDFKERCGEAVFMQDGKEYTTYLYQGNALLIFLNEWTTEEGENMYSLYSFFADKEHMKNCLGLNKKYSTENMFDDERCKLKKIKLNKKHTRYIKDIVDILIKAFDKIEIEIYKD